MMKFTSICSIILLCFFTVQSEDPIIIENQNPPVNGKDCFNEGYMRNLKDYYEDCAESEGDDEWKIALCTFKKDGVLNDEKDDEFDFDKYKTRTVKQLTNNDNISKVEAQFEKCNKQTNETLQYEFFKCVRVYIEEICFNKQE